jgi:hypothetical protein
MMTTTDRMKMQKMIVKASVGKKWTEELSKMIKKMRKKDSR